MPSAGDYGYYRKLFRDISGELTVAAATDDTTLVTVRGAGYTIYIQRLYFVVLTDAAQSISFEDSNGTAKVIAQVPASPGKGTVFEWDYGAKGISLTEAKNFVMNVSAAGLAGKLTWSGYMKQTATISHLDTVQ